MAYGKVYVYGNELDGTTFEWTSIFSAARCVFYFIFPPLIEFLPCPAKTLSSGRAEKGRPPRVALFSLTLPALLLFPPWLVHSVFRPVWGSCAGLSTMHQLPYSAIPRWWTGRCEACDYLRRRHYRPGIIQALPVTFSTHEGAALPIGKVNTLANTGNPEWGIERGTAAGVDRSLSIFLTFYRRWWL